MTTASIPDGCRTDLSVTFNLRYVYGNGTYYDSLPLGRDDPNTGVRFTGSFTLQKSILKNQRNETIYIGTDYTFGPTNDTSASYVLRSDGFSLCTNNTLAHGESTAWWNCPTFVYATYQNSSCTESFLSAFNLTSIPEAPSISSTDPASSISSTEASPSTFATEPSSTTSASASDTSSAISTTAATASSPSASAVAVRSNTGAIAGGTVAGVVATAIILGLLFFFRRRRNRRSKPVAMSNASRSRQEKAQLHSDYVHPVRREMVGSAVPPTMLEKRNGRLSELPANEDVRWENKGLLGELPSNEMHGSDHHPDSTKVGDHSSRVT